MLIREGDGKGMQGRRGGFDVYGLNKRCVYLTLTPVQFIWIGSTGHHWEGSGRSVAVGRDGSMYKTDLLRWT